jgi:hypothetical protein
VGAAGIVVGTVLGVMAVTKKDDAVSERVQVTSMDLKSSADSLATGSTVSFIVGGVLLAAGVVWWVLDHQSPKKSGSSSFHPSWAGLGGTLP